MPLSDDERVSEDELAEWEAVAQQATTGPWLALEYWDVYAVTAAKGVPIIPVAESVNRARGCSEADAVFIATAREALPRLLAEVRALRAAQ